jgi:iron-sulfur cluster repair protein YtfE (RIC family)
MATSATNETTVQASYGEDHDRLDGLMASYRQWKHTDFGRAREAFKEFNKGLKRHILWEESILFPLFEEKTGMRALGPTVVMRAEHRDIGRWLEALHDKVRRHDVATEPEEDALCRTLLAHNQKEENVLYPALDRMLTVEEKAAVFKKMEELPEESYQTCCGSAV